MRQTLAFILCIFLLPVVAQEEAEMLDYPPPSSDYPSNGYNRDEFFKEKSQGTRERIYPVGMSDDGLLCYATELPNIRCECDAFQVTVKDLTNDSTVFIHFKVYDHSDQESSAGVDAFGNSLDYVSDSGDQVCYSFDCFWYSEYQNFADTLRHFGIRSLEEITKHYDSDVMYRYTSDSSKNIVSVSQMLDKEKETLFTLPFYLDDMRFHSISGYYSFSNRPTKNILILTYALPDPQFDELYHCFYEFKEVSAGQKRPGGPDTLKINGNQSPDKAWRPLSLKEEPVDLDQDQSEGGWIMESGMESAFTAYTNDKFYEYFRRRGYMYYDDLDEQRLFPEVLDFEGQTLFRALSIGSYPFSLKLYGDSISGNDTITHFSHLILGNTDSMETSLWLEAPDEAEFLWAVIYDSVVYITSHGSISGQDGSSFLTAIDLADKDVLWEQEVEGLHRGNFWVYRDAILLTTTGDDHHIRLLNRFTGKQQHQTPLNSTPKWVLVWDDQLHVYTEKGALLFSLESSFFRAP